MSLYLKDNKELMKEYDYEKNKNLDLDNLLEGSGKKAWWKCSKCGGSWQIYIVNRYHGSKCPYCSNRKVLKGFNDLTTKYPEIAKEWNYEKNGDLIPDEIIYGSNKKVWWKCSKCSYEWQASIVSRTNIGNDCRNCAINSVGDKIKQTKIKKYGNLVQSHPEIAKEWNYEKNGDLIPENFHLGSTEKVWWKCPLGHEYQQYINARTKDNYNCTICANESHSSFPEQTIFFYLNKCFKDYSIYNRYIIQNYEADIYVEELKLAIEYDGYYFHNNSNTINRENKKNKFFKENGIKLIRVKENAKKDIISSDDTDVIALKKDPNYKELDDMLMKLFDRISQIYEARIEYNIDVEKDKNSIMNSYIYNIKKNSLLAKFPKIAKEWNYDKNGNLTPSMFSFASSRIVWWKCSKGHEWEDSINNRTHGNGCLICSNRKVMFGVNDLATKYPEIAKEWNYEKNGDLTPQSVVYGSTKKVWWKCSKGHEWEEKIHDIIDKKSKIKCPYCSNRKVLTGFNDLTTKNPEIAKEWNYEKNGYLTPQNVIFNKDRKYWWKCSNCCFEWESSLRNRLLFNVGCPKCGIKKQVESFNRNQVIKKGSLLQNNPKLAKEWNYEKNGDLTPDNIISTSNKKVWWKCSKGHEWEASIIKRNCGTGCPQCYKEKRMTK